jgi:transposase-like protein
LAADREEAAAALNWVDEIVLSLYAKGLTTGEISAHNA